MHLSGLGTCMQDPVWLSKAMQPRTELSLDGSYKETAKSKNQDQKFSLVSKASAWKIFRQRGLSLA